MKRKSFYLTLTAILVLCLSFFSACSESVEKKTEDNTSSETSVNYEFKHGVASGDPLSDKVIIWTRLTPADENTTNTFNINWQMATKSDFSSSSVVKSGSKQTNSSIDFTVKVDVEDLSSSTKYYYKFSIEDSETKETITSPIGETKTLPEEDSEVDQVKLAVVSGQDFQQGYFYVYREINSTSNLDAIVHLGDYIFEYNASQYGENVNSALWQPVASRVAKLEPKTELISLDDYRQRYATYKTDKDLQEAHRRFPFIMIWDDHEIAFNSYVDGADGHDSSEGEFATRKELAIQAFYEWLPIRQTDSSEKEKIYRDFNFGDLVHLNMIDSRNYAREKNVEFDDIQTYLENLSFTSMSSLVKNKKLTLLGDTQQYWLENNFKNSSAVWEVLGNSLVMEDINIPVGVYFSFDVANSPTENIMQISDYLANIVTEVNSSEEPLMTGIPYFLNSWSSYPNERDFIFDITEQYNKNLIMLYGDLRTGILQEFKDENDSLIGIGVGANSVSAGGMEIDMKIGEDDESLYRYMFKSANQDLKHINLLNRGYTLLTFNRDEVLVDYIYLDSVKNSTYSVLDGFATTSKNKSYSLSLIDGSKAYIDSSFKVIESLSTTGLTGVQTELLPFVDGTDSIAFKVLDENITNFKFGFGIYEDDSSYLASSDFKNGYFKINEDSDEAILHIFYQEHLEGKTFEIEVEYDDKSAVFTGTLSPTTIGNPVLIELKEVEDTNTSLELNLLYFKSKTHFKI